MGTYTELSLDGYNVFSSKSSPQPELMMVFAEGDRHTRVRANEETGTRAGPWTRGQVVVAAGEESALRDYAYVAEVHQVRDRLDLMGFTLERARLDYESGHSAQVQFLRDMLARHNDETGEVWVERVRNELRVLEGLAFDAWLAAFRWMKNRGAHVVEDGPVSAGLEGYCITRDGVPEEVQLMFGDGVDADGLYGFYGTDVRLYLRSLLEICADDSLLVQDITDLVDGGYFAETGRVAELCRLMLTADYPVNARVVILTEGSTDQEFLERSLALLYPHLADYYSFMDFQNMAVRGGAGALVATVKAFAGAGIANRVIALVDNDTAGRDAIRQLSALTLPETYRVLPYPPLSIARTWPTIGPTGPATVDVNGLAGSIELYFGEDILRSGDALEPVQWRGLIDGMGEYQGELIAKIELQKRFREKLRRASQDRTLLATLDWSGMRAILEAVRKAFQ